MASEGHPVKQLSFALVVLKDCGHPGAPNFYRNVCKVNLLHMDTFTLNKSLLKRYEQS